MKYKLSIAVAMAAALALGASAAGKSIKTLVGIPGRHTVASEGKNASAAGLQLNNRISLTKPTKRKTAENGVFFESFEYDCPAPAWQESTADLAWLPDGWTRISDSKVTGDIDKWYAHPFSYITMMPGYDGDYAMAVLYNDKYKDEWLVSPEISISANQYLTFGWYYLPVYFWVIDRDHVDFDKGVFKKRETTVAFQVMISADGGDWQLLKDMSDDFADMEYEELADIYPEKMMDASISLAEYAGKTVKLAFRYVGKDGNSLFIDGVSVNNGTQQVDALYAPPVTTMYLGGTVDMNVADLGIQIQPTNIDLTWENWSDNAPGTEYEWSWTGELPVTDKDDDSLTMKFPCPTGEEGLSYDLYFPPVLEASAEGSRDNNYMENVMLMAGGKAEDDNATYGLLPFDLHNDGIGAYLEEPEDFGQRGIPVFGYSDATDKYWLNYVRGGNNELSAVSEAYVSGIVNAILVPDNQAIVVDKAWLYVIGKINPEARFSCMIFSLNEDGEFSNLVADNTITGSEVIQTDTEMSLFYYTLPFEFDEPIVLDADGTEGNMYAIVITGMHDGGVEYFAPLMQKYPNKFQRCYSFYLLDIVFSGEPISSIGFVADHKNEYGEMFDAFAINLDASYPWLECEDSEIDLDNGPVTLEMQSYYNASNLKVTLKNGKSLPSWLTVSKKGQYDNTRLTFSAAADGEAFDGDIMISAPGVKKIVHVKHTAGICDAIAGDNKEIISIHDLTGRTVVNEPARGVYIIRHADGSTTKVIR